MKQWKRLLAFSLCLLLGLGLWSVPSYAAVKEESEFVLDGTVTGYAVPAPGGKAEASVRSAAALAATVPTQQQAYNSMIALRSSYPEGMPWTNMNGYSWKGGIYTTGYGCAGFAFLLSDAAFGDLPARIIEQVDITRVHVGDILRVNNDTHSVIVLEVYTSYVVIAEGNYNSSIHWGRTMSAAEVAESTYMMTRYPVGTFGAAYTISYNSNGGGEAPESQLIEATGGNLTYSTPFRLGYEFLGWSRSSSATTATYQAGGFIKPTANMTLYAVWKKVNYPSITGPYPKDVKVTIPSRDDLIFYTVNIPKSGDYVIRSLSGKDTEAGLFNMAGEMIYYSDDVYNYDFSIEAYLAAGNYYLAIGSYEYSSVTVTVRVSEAKDAWVPTPAISSVANAANGVKVSWNVVPGAEKYRVYRKSGSASWTKLADTTSVSYTDTTAVSGVKYSYTVRCISADGSRFTSGYNTTGKSITYIAAPTIATIENVKGGVKMTWNKPAGAVNFRVYRKSGSSSWTKVGDTTGTTYTDKTVAGGTTYSYTIRCLSADAASFTSSYNNTGKTIKYITAPVISAIENVKGGVKVTWNKPAGAVNFRLYRKSGSGSWTKVGDTTGTTYTDKTAVGGTTYSYTVRCLSSDAKSYASGYDNTGKSIKYIAAPVLTKISNSITGITLTWNKSAGAAKYRVYRKSGSGSWTKLADTTAVSYTDKTAASGTTYSYTVRCLNADGNVFTSGYDTAGLSLLRLSVPTPKSAVNSAAGTVTVSWSAVTGAGGYYVYRKTGSTSWTKVGTVTGQSTVSYMDTTAVKGSSYTYTIRAYKGSSVSDFNGTGVSVSVAR